jgi:hypothetical protein
VKELLKQLASIPFIVGMFGGWIFAVCHILFDFFVSKSLDLSSFISNDMVAIVTGIGFWIFFKVKSEEINAHYSKQIDNE